MLCYKNIEIDLINTMKNNDEFIKWFLETNEKTGGLINQTIAGELLKTSRQYINQLIKEKKIKQYKFNKHKLISLNEILKYKIIKESITK